MKSLKLILCLLIIPVLSFSQDLSTYDLTCGHRKNPVGTDVPQPRLSWKIKKSARLPCWPSPRLAFPSVIPSSVSA